MTTGAKIKTYRKIKGLTQKELGDLTNMLEASIRKYELGVRHPRPDQLIKIATALDVSPLMLFDLNYEGLNIKTVADALALIFLLEEQLDVSLVPEKDKSGNPVPNTAVMRFNDHVLVSKLCDWMKAKTILQNAKNGESDALPDELKAVQDAQMKEIEFIIGRCKAEIIDTELLITPKNSDN